MACSDNGRLVIESKTVEYELRPLSGTEEKSLSSSSLYSFSVALSIFLFTSPISSVSSSSSSDWISSLEISLVSLSCCDTTLSFSVCWVSSSLKFKVPSWILVFFSLLLILKP